MSIAKRDGTRRIIHNPDERLRVYQYKILNEILNKVDIPDYIYAFEKMKSIPSMAMAHVNKRVVLSIDLKDFFHSIKQNKIHSILTNLNIGEQPAREISELCTYKYFVPQGALTSPKVANIITAATFGPKVKEYCDSNNLTLTIYADDITMSTNTEGTIDTRKILTDVMEIIKEYGFRINYKKTKVMFKSTRQYVCGVVVNQKTNLIKKERYILRAIVHNITVNGLDAEAEKNNTEPETFLRQIRGRINWFTQLNPELGAKLNAKLVSYINTLKNDDIQIPNVIIYDEVGPMTESSEPKEEEIPETKQNLV